MSGGGGAGAYYHILLFNVIIMHDIMMFRNVSNAANVPFSDKALAVAVYVSVKPGMEESFKEASLKNARNSVQEEGISRFDLVQVCSYFAFRASRPIIPFIG